MRQMSQVRKPTPAKPQGAVGEADLDKVAGSGGPAGVNPSRS
jgi:hypothetical protein